MRKYRYLILALLVLALTVTTVGAAEQASSIIVSYGAIIGFVDGDLVVDFDINTSSMATTLGATRVDIQELRSSGWFTVATYLPEYYPDMLGSYAWHHGSDVTYGAYRDGYEYRAVVQYIAENEEYCDTAVYYTISVTP